jgi:hypothetical protein
MRSGIWLLTLSMVVSTNTSALAQKGRKGRGSQVEAVKNGWLFSLAEGKALAAKNNNPLMVVMRCVP